MICCKQYIRNTDLIDENSGILFKPNNVQDCQKAIEKILSKDFSKLGLYNSEKIKQFNVENINLKLKDIYSKCILE